jgi:hypothetical protein
MAFRRVRHARIVMLVVPGCPESGFLGRAARPPPVIGSTALRSSYEASMPYEGAGMGVSGGVQGVRVRQKQAARWSLTMPQACMVA